jgi:hypothetical protein
MAYEIPDFSFSLPAAADLSAAQYKFVKVNTSGQAALVATAGVDAHGVLQNDPAAAGRAATVLFSGITKVVAGGTVTVGARASIDSSGRAVVATGPASCGTFLSAGAVGEIVTMLLQLPTEAVLVNPGTTRVATLTGADVLTVASAKFQKLDPGGASRNVDLPAEELSVGISYRVCNAADAAENLVIRNDAAATIVTLNQNEACWLACDGTTWTHFGVETIALT